MAWEYETFGPDGQCKLFGVNIFDYDWQTTGKRVKVKDPIYHQDHTFEVWQVEIDGQPGDPPRRTAAAHGGSGLEGRLRQPRGKWPGRINF